MCGKYKESDLPPQLGCRAERHSQGHGHTGYGVSESPWESALSIVQGKVQGIVTVLPNQNGPAIPPFCPDSSASQLAGPGNSDEISKSHTQVVVCPKRVWPQIKSRIRAVGSTCASTTVRCTHRAHSLWPIPTVARRMGSRGEGRYSTLCSRNEIITTGLVPLLLCSYQRRSADFEYET